MSSKLYAVQYRYMHDARHYLLTYARRELARRALLILAHADRTGDTPYELPEALDNVEIDYRRPPSVIGDAYVEIINPKRGEQPDVFWA